MSSPTTPPVVLSIAGSDSGGGAGIQADLKTFEAHGVFGTTVITAVTAQNTRGVRRVHHVPGTVVKAQLMTVFDDFDIAAIKIGMLGNAAVTRAVAQVLRRFAADIPIVLDPVMVATSGDRLLDEGAEGALRQELFPLATLLTPNAPEAEALTGIAVDHKDEAREAALQLAAELPETYILVKGAHLRVSESSGQRLAQDLLYFQGEEHLYSDLYIDAGPLHGTGCTLSSAIAANLANGLDVKTAIKQAKTYVTDAILLAPKNLGHGARPLLHKLPGN